MRNAKVPKGWYFHPGAEMLAMMRGASEGLDKKEAKIRRKLPRDWTAAEKRFIDWLGKLRQAEKGSIDKGSR